jgi:hypothetical protein
MPDDCPNHRTQILLPAATEAHDGVSSAEPTCMPRHKIYDQTKTFFFFFFIIIINIYVYTSLYILTNPINLI